MKVPFFAVRRSVDRDDELSIAATRVIESGHYILGPEVEAFEHEAAEYLGVAHAVGVSNGTDALVVALEAALPPGTDVLAVPVFTFIATATAAMRAGLRIAFYDVNDEDLTIVNPRTWHGSDFQALPVHLFGRVAGVRGLVEDGAQAFGNLKIDADDMRTVCYSFFPTKNLGGFGDGGLVATNDADVAARVRMLRNHGSKVRYTHEEFGGNYRLDELQAALLRVALRYVDKDLVSRENHDLRYRDRLAGLQARGILRLPPTIAAPNQFVIRTKSRDSLREFLRCHGVGTEVYYPTPLHLQPCFAHLGYGPGDFPVAERAAKEVLALPIFPGLRPEEIEHVCRTIVRFFD